MITTAEYKARRKHLASLLPKDSIALIFASNEIVRNGDAHYRFRQDSNFYYLTGFNEADAILVIDPQNTQSILFNKVHDIQNEIWNGKILGQEGACTELKVDAAYPISEINTHLQELLKTKKLIYFDMLQFSNYEQYVFPIIKHLQSTSQRGDAPCERLHDLKPLLSEMRLKKSPAEIDLMRKAAEISVAAHKKACETIKKLNNEAEVEAELNYELQRLGCRNVAYESIVAGGNNACTLHYIANNQPLDKNSLLLIDAGGEYANYAADITRVFPISGKFNQEQRQIYELVLKAQRAAIALVKPGTVWNDLQDTIIEIITSGLIELGILQGKTSELIRSKAYREFYMHGSGHWLGLDVHDCGNYKVNGAWRKLEPGMVLTVEPGIYIREGTENVAKRWQGIGVRIEDDLLVTASGYENLSAALPVEIEQIEAYMCD